MQHDSQERVDVSIVGEYTATVEYLRKGRGMKVPEILSQVGFSYATHNNIIRKPKDNITTKVLVKLQEFVKKYAADVSQYNILNGMSDVSKATTVSLADLGNGNGNGKVSEEELNEVVEKAKKFTNPVNDCGFWGQLQKLIAIKPDNIEIEIRVK